MITDYKNLITFNSDEVDTCCQTCVAHNTLTKFLVFLSTFQNIFKHKSNISWKRKTNLANAHMKTKAILPWIYTRIPHEYSTIISKMVYSGILYDY